ncbi:MAG: DUF2975 domain-containing protein [Solirubrobacterales bacterium]|nr:DUF2975 domain-containing protein [Solirubrobacterales bacterium]
MGNITISALRVVLGLVIAGSLFVQTVMIPMLAKDLKEDFSGEIADVAVPIIVIVVFGFIAIQVTSVCIWQLLSLLRRDALFSDASFRYVDVIIGSVVTASILAFALGVVLAPGESVAPGVVLLIGGVAVVFAGIALVILLMRVLLVQAITRDVQASHLESELREVI